jgi:hypothetical protein
MTARIGAMSIDGTPISAADLARLDAEEKLHAARQRSAVWVVAAGALDVQDCQTLLSILGLDHDTVAAARAERVKPAACAERVEPASKPRRRRAAA